MSDERASVSGSKKRKSNEESDNIVRNEEGDFCVRNCANFVKRLKGELSNFGESWLSNKADPVIALMIHSMAYMSDKKNINKIKHSQDPKPEFVLPTVCGDIDAVKLLADILSSFSQNKLATLNELMFTRKDRPTEIMIEGFHTIVKEIDTAGVTFKKQETEQLRKLIGLLESLKTTKSPSCISSISSNEEMLSKIITRSSAASASIESKRKGKAMSHHQEEQDEE